MIDEAHIETRIWRSDDPDSPISDHAVQLRHKSTGIEVICDRYDSQVRNKEAALSELAERLRGEADRTSGLSEKSPGRSSRGTGMPTPIFLSILTLICPALLTARTLAVTAMYPEMSFSAGVLLRLTTFIAAALLITFLFTQRERRGFCFGEFWSLVILCLIWTLALESPGIAATAEQMPAPQPRGTVIVWGMAVAFDLLMLHVAFGVVARRFVAMRVKSFSLEERPFES